MKILMTGFTTRMAGKPATKPEKDYLSTSFLLAEILREQLGHDVDHRKVTPGEDLSQYDLAILGICPTGGPAERADCVTGSAWTFTHARCPKLLFCEDWRIEEAETQCPSTLRHWARYAAHKKYDPIAEEFVPPMLQAIIDQPLPLLATFFPWGNHRCLFNQKNLGKAVILKWDPSPFLRLPQPMTVPDSERGRRWALATLQNKYDVRPDFAWPIDRFGKDNRVNENELIQNRYPQYWGVLAPGYKSAGSGYWRVRFNHAAHVGAVMVCDRNDARVMGAPYQVSWTVETLSTEELVAQAQQQRDWFYANIATKDKTLSDLNNALEVAVGSSVSVLA
jgi:hypothetical protein